MKLKLYTYFASILIFFNSIILVYLSAHILKNPDYDAYKSLLLTSNSFNLSVEPTIYLFSFISKFFSSVLFVDSLDVFYFIYVYLIQFFLYCSFLNFFKNDVLKSVFALFFWMGVYGLMHCLIQIRFGLANSISIYILSLAIIAPSLKKTFLFSFFAFFTHYSSAFIVLSSFIIYIRGVIFYKKSYLLLHLIFIGLMLLFKFGAIFSLLPEFLYGRIAGYLSGDQIEPVSALTMIISFLCYLLMILAPKSKSEINNSLRIYGALGFIPYFLVPDLEIIVRLGISFQYLLIPYLLLTYKIKKLFLFTTFPLIIFFCYKFNSSFNAFIEYLY